MLTLLPYVRKFDLFYTGVGFQTPCYSNLSTYLVPQSTSPPDYWLVTQYAFARSYQLVPPKGPTHTRLRSGDIAGIALGALIVVFIVTSLGIWRFVCHRRQQHHDVAVMSCVSGTRNSLEPSRNVETLAKGGRATISGSCSTELRSPIIEPREPPCYSEEDRPLWPLPLAPSKRMAKLLQ